MPELPFPLDLPDCLIFHKLCKIILDKTHAGVVHVNYDDLAKLLGFPKKGKLSTWLKDCEERLKEYVGKTAIGASGRAIRLPVKLIARDGQGSHGITEEGLRVREAVNKILTECKAAANRLSLPRVKGRLVVAATDSVVEYLFPAVLANYSDWRTGEVRLRFLRFLPGKIVSQILNERVDVAITWHGFGVNYDKDYVKVEEWPDSEVPVHAIMHPKHALAQRMDPAASDLVIPAEELRHYPIVYPVLTQLGQLARSLNPANSHQIGALPAVFNTVCRDEQVVGLFPGGPWPDLAQLRREGCIRHAKLKIRPNENEEIKKKYRMHLRVIMAEGGQDKLTAEAFEFVKAIRRTLKTTLGLTQIHNISNEAKTI